jgi:hypothetical protein
MIEIPRYNQADKVSISFIAFLVAIAMSRGLSWKTFGLSSAPVQDADQLNRLADWLIDRYPSEFSREGD